jgi:ATP-binding cassette subfamily C protein PrsD
LRPTNDNQPSTFLKTLRGCRGALIAVALFSAVVNVLYLTGAFYMLQVYDRVITSGSVPTLVALSVLAGLLYAGQGLLDFFRGRLLSGIAQRLDERLSPRIFDLVARGPLASVSAGIGLQPVRDIDQIRGVLASGGPLGFLDLPWIPFYLAICFLFHPVIGVAALAGAVILVALTLCAEVFTRKPIKAAAADGAKRFGIAEAARRNADVVRAMGMGPALAARWGSVNQSHLDGQSRASGVAGALGSVSKVARMALQSAVLGIGAWLVIQGEASAGIIIAGSILSARALAPIELVIAHWKGFVAARQGWARLRTLFAQIPEEPAHLPLRPPAASLSVEGAAICPPGEQRLVVQGVSFAMQAGGGLGIIGPSGSGKSSLARALVGVWRPARGSVRLDGAALDQWSPHTLGRHIGYLPQDIELFDGTIAENIARFDPDTDPEAVIRAAEQAGVHELIVHLPQGYDTKVGEGGLALSGGQRQRIALARALYHDPFLVVLDEPNSNLDGDGEQALTRAIANVRAYGGIAIVIAHRPSALAAVDQVLVMAEGQAKAFGPKDEILRKAVRPVALAIPQPAAGAA